MADKEQYHLSKPAAEIDAILSGSVRFNVAQKLTAQEQSQAIENLGIDADKLGFGIDGYFDTLDELTATITNPNRGDSYGVGLAYPYDIYTWDALRGRWVNNGPIKGADGKDGSDAEVTAENIKLALGYDPAALSFTVILSAAGWAENKQTIENDNFIASGYAYIVSPASASFTPYGEAQICADDISTDGSMAFNCANVPTVDLTVNIVRMVST